MSTDNFLSRWSRRKQQARKPEPAGHDAVPPEPEAVQSDTGSEIANSSDPGAPSLVAEEQAETDLIARLPSLDALTAESDLGPFLQKGVPEVLRNAALRRMWSLDPKVRDYLSEAREYAYDWNTLGGVPGMAPLPPSEEIARMAARIVGGGDLNTGEPLNARENSGARSAASNRPPDASTRSQDREQLSSEDTVDKAETAPLVSGDGEASGERGSFPSASNRPGSLALPPFPNAQPIRDIEQVTEPACPDLSDPGQPRRHGGAIPV